MYWCNICDGIFEYPGEQDNSDYLIDEKGHKYINAVSFTEVCPYCKHGDYEEFEVIYQCECGEIFTEPSKGLGQECCPNCRSINFKEIEVEQ